MPPNLKGEVALTARAELDGLGPAEGPAVTWFVPADFAQVQPPTALPFGVNPGAASPRTDAPGWGSWLGLAFLILAVAFVLGRTRSRSP